MNTTAIIATTTTTTTTSSTVVTATTTYTKSYTGPRSVMMSVTALLHRYMILLL